jgi:5-methylcytosine-specific restriction protein A
VGVGDITERSAVLAAIKECDELGREAFLERYGFGAAKLYHLVFNGKNYDLKAILGVAHKFQFGAPLGSTEFSGGLATVVPKLQELGFEVMLSSR